MGVIVETEYLASQHLIGLSAPLVLYFRKGYRIFPVMISKSSEKRLYMPRPRLDY